MSGFTIPEPAASQRELDQLRAQVTAMDGSGTRGVGIVQSQLSEVIKGLAEFKAETAAKFVAHDLLHEREESRRRSERHWLVSTIIALLVMVFAALGLLVDVVRTVHH